MRLNDMPIPCHHGVFSIYLRLCHYEMGHCDCMGNRVSEGGDRCFLLYSALQQRHRILPEEHMHLETHCSKYSWGKLKIGNIKIPQRRLLLQYLWSEWKQNVPESFCWCLLTLLTVSHPSSLRAWDNLDRLQLHTQTSCDYLYWTSDPFWGLDIFGQMESNRDKIRLYFSYLNFKSPYFG